MYDVLIQKMKRQGIIFTEGLNDKEIIRIEQRFEISFPKELKNFYKRALPISEGFYNWRDRNEKNVQKIKDAMKMPVLGIIKGAEEIEWCEAWGEEPDDLKERKKIIVSMVSKAPKLIPIYSHRYMAAVECEINPVFSIWGTDVIYYGKSLMDYLMIEFKLKKQEIFMNDEVNYIPFWSDVL